MSEGYKEAQRRMIQKQAREVINLFYCLLSTLSRLM